MKSISLYSLGEPPVFSVIDTAENYWTERLNYELSYNLYLMNQADMGVSVPEMDDATSVVSWLDDALEVVRDYYDNMLAWEVSGGQGDIPIMGELGEYPDSENADMILAGIAIQGKLRELISAINAPPARLNQVEMIGLLQQIKDQEGVLSIGDHAVWSKSIAVDEI
jgi:hypothetical protein